MSNKEITVCAGCHRVMKTANSTSFLCTGDSVEMGIGYIDICLQCMANWQRLPVADRTALAFAQFYMTTYPFRKFLDTTELDNSRTFMRCLGCGYRVHIADKRCFTCKWKVIRKVIGILPQQIRIGVLEYWDVKCTDTNVYWHSPT
jgi:hypothetical protein